MPGLKCCWLDATDALPTVLAPAEHQGSKGGAVGQADRLVKLRALLEARRSVPRDVALRQLEVSLATLKRDIAFLRDRLNTSIVRDRDTRAWQLDRGANAGGTQPQPGRADGTRGLAAAAGALPGQPVPRCQVPSAQ